jgi:MraZ protein
MPLFLSSYTNKVDSKGRVSVPSSFRAALASESYQGIVVFRSGNHPALEGFSWSFMEEVAGRLDHFELFSDKQDDMATAVFGDSVQLPFDGEGRVVLSEDLMKFAGIKDVACFVGLGRKFQIWNPAEFEKRRHEARKSVKGVTLPKGIA